MESYLPRLFRSSRLPQQTANAESGVALDVGSCFRLRSYGHLPADTFKHLLFAVYQRVYIVCREFKPVPMRNRVRRARFHAITAKNTPRIIDVVNFGVTIACGNTVIFRILSSFNIDAIRWTGRRAQKASDALLKIIFIAMEDVNPAVAWLKIHRLMRIILGHGLTKHILERDAETFYQGD
jgi:hypothetical protein